MVKEGQFPKPRKLAPHAVGWLEPKIAEWLNSRPPV
jgi:predicted DNA-binding transcriptional regulator AlpA